MSNEFWFPLAKVQLWGDIMLVTCWLSALTIYIKLRVFK